MVLEAESLEPIYDPSEDQVRAILLGLSIRQSSYVSLTDEIGNYIQAAGSRPWCAIERRHLEPLKHERAFQYTPTPKYRDGAMLRSGSGDIPMKHDEWFLLKDAAEVFVAFLRREKLPAYVSWRSMHEILGLREG